MAGNTGKAGGQFDNKNSSQNKRMWKETINRVLLQDDVDGSKLRKVAEALINKAQEGDIQAIKELGDRIDGKVAQTIQGAGDNGEILTSLTIEFVGDE